jgi:hypothetical protein
MAKNIVSQLTEIQDEVAELRKYKKSVQKYLKKSADFLDKKQAEKPSDFESEICVFYGLGSEAEKKKWLAVMLNDQSRRFWERQSGTPTETKETP